MYTYLCFRLIETGRNLDKGASDNLYLVAQALISIGHLESATELYQKLGDQHAMVMMAVKMENWEQAFQLVKQNPEYKEEVYIPYAQQMARDNHFIEAHKGSYIFHNIYVCTNEYDSIYCTNRYFNLYFSTMNINNIF